MREEDYLAIKDRAADRFLKIPHVNAVGIGSREKNGRPTGEPAIKVFVTLKKPAHEVPPEELIPAQFEGLPTDVLQMSPAIRRGVDGTTHPGGMIDDFTRFDPLRGGGCISLEGKTGLGTLGCMLRDRQDGSAIYGLTNYHVVTKDNKLSRSRRVCHPSTIDLEFDPASSIAIVSDGALDASRDAAVIRLEALTSWIPFVEEIGYLRGTHDVTHDEAVAGTYQVRKRGSKTRLTGGVIVGLGDVVVEKIRQRNNLIIRPNRPDPPGDDTWFFSFEGDSGSVVVNDQNEVVGLSYAFENPGQNPGPQDGYGFAFAIGAVLERFKTVDGLDLEVATSVNAAATDPNDPSEKKEVPFPAGAPALSAGDRIRLADHHYYRPLIGAAQVLAEQIGEANAGTLGCILTDSASSNTAYMLTSYGGISLNGHIPPNNDTNVGQPNHDHSISGCCSNLVGAFRGAVPQAAPTAAVVKLDKDQKWLAEIMRIGLVAGSYTVTEDDVTTLGPFRVLKCGAASRLTGGVVIRIPGMSTPPPAGVPDGVMLIRPNDDPLKPHDEVHFGRLGDFGAVLVDTHNRVVGVLHDEIDIPDATGRHVFHGLATPIATVIDGLKAQANLDLTVAFDTEVGNVQVVARVSTEEAAPARSAPAEAVINSAEPASVDALPEALLQTPGGESAFAVWRRHQAELRDLVTRNRRVAAAWQRSGGPALVQMLIRAAHAPSKAIPDNVNGLPLVVCLDKLESVFSRYGSAGLRTDLARLRECLPSASGFSLADALAALDLWSPVADRP